MGRNAIGLFVCAVLGGCGSVKDAGFADAGVDASTIDADETGMATVVTQSALFGGTPGAAAANIDIVSMLPDNTLLEAKQTDAGGNATIKVYPGGTVTAIYKHTLDLGADLITWVGVKPGDTLRFGNRNPQQTGSATNLGSMNYQVPSQAGSQQYVVRSTCNQTGAFAPPPAIPATTFSMAEFSTCHREPMDTIFYAFSPAGVTHFGFRQNVPFAPGGTVTLGGWQPVANATLNVTGLPAEVESVFARFGVVIDGDSEINVIGNINTGTVTGGAFTQTIPWGPTGERAIGTLFLQRTGFQSMRVMDSFTANTTSWTVASPALAPWLQSGAIASSALKLASWFVVGDASTYDAALLRVDWSFKIDSTFHPHSWHFIVPPGVSSLAFPKLPSQFTDQMPHPQDGIGAQVRLLEIPTISGYDALRALPSSNVMCIECAVRAGEIQRAIVSGF